MTQMKQPPENPGRFKPIYDQGHIVNDRDLKDDAVEQINTYVMSNMSPQHCRFNRGIWLTLEHLGRQWAKDYGKVHVTAGAIFDFNRRDNRDKDQSAARMGSRSQNARVAIPSHYYKVFLRRVGSEWHSIAFIMENHNGPRGASWDDVKPELMASITSLANIEKRSETSLHPSLDRALLIESGSGENWNFAGGASNLENGCPK
jgi:endonuclease G, mitochondrial